MVEYAQRLSPSRGGERQAAITTLREAANGRGSWVSYGGRVHNGESPKGGGGEAVQADECNLRFRVQSLGFRISHAVNTTPRAHTCAWWCGVA